MSCQPARQGSRSYADGGGKAPAIPEPIHGAFEAARYLADLGRRMELEEISLVLADVNGQPGAIAQDASGRTLSALSVDIVEDRVGAQRAVTNPDKLVHVSVR